MNPWKIAGASLLALLVMVGLARSCEIVPPLVIPDWADSLRAVRERYAVDSAIMIQKVSLLASRADSAKREAETWRRRSLASRPTRPATNVPSGNASNVAVPNPGTIAPDSGMSSYSFTDRRDSSSYSLTIDSLWNALDAADSAFANLERAFDAQKQATAAALSGWAAADSALLRERNVATRAIGDLTARLRKAQRGCRIVWAISCPEATGGYGAVLSDGQVHHGPGVQVGFKIKLGGG